MSTQTLEERVAFLESQVHALRVELRATQQNLEQDWRRTIGAFTDDEGMKEILQEAMRLREADRTKSRSKATERQSNQ